MQISLMGAAIAGLVGAAVAIVVSASGLANRGSGISIKKMAHATINLDLRANGDCAITSTPQTLEVFKRETVQWSIIDRCGLAPASEIEIKFPSGDPLDAACVRRGKKKIQCGLKAGVDGGIYKYTVEAPGATTEDPELEIVQ